MFLIKKNNNQLRCSLFTEIFFKVYKPLYFFFFKYWSHHCSTDLNCCLNHSTNPAVTSESRHYRTCRLTRTEVGRSEPRRRGVVQPSLFWERARADAHCWVCKQVTSTHCEGWINTPPPSPHFYPLPPPNQPPTPARPLHLSPLCGDYRTVWKEEEPSILFPSQSSPLAFTRTPPSACTYANAVITLHFTAVVFPSLLLAGWRFSSPSLSRLPSCIHAYVQWKNCSIATTDSRYFYSQNYFRRIFFHCQFLAIKTAILGDNIANFWGLILTLKKCACGLCFRPSSWPFSIRLFSAYLLPYTQWVGCLDSGPRGKVCVWEQWGIWFWKARKGKWCWGVCGSESIWETETTGVRPDLVISSILKHTSKYTHLVPLPHQTDSLNPFTNQNHPPPPLSLVCPIPTILYTIYTIPTPSLSLSLTTLFVSRCESSLQRFD